ncbi:MAG TPA: hypothetical protein VF086_09540 [Propionibacteriaceae bacterium]
MEQAEQLFSGAASADYVIKPILIFYGFSQACRAMAASSSALDHETFRPRSHGLEVTAQPAVLADLKVAPRHEASTSMLATLQTMLGSTPWSEPLTLGQLWSANPDLAEVPLPDCAAPEALRIGINQISSDPAIPLQVRISQLSRRLLTGTDESDVQQLLSTTYPIVADTLPPNPPQFGGKPPPTIDGDDVKVNVLRSLPLDGRDLTQVIEQRTMWRDSQSWLIPRLGGTVGPPHLLVVWWALLFALSMRARYDPERWTRDLDPDQSASSAVVLETMLDMSMGICPELLVETMPSV